MTQRPVRRQTSSPRAPRPNGEGTAAVAGTATCTAGGSAAKVNAVEDVVFVIPVFNEGSVIAEVVEGLLATGARVVCVNDGSRDSSAMEIDRSGAFLVDHPM